MNTQEFHDNGHSILSPSGIGKWGECTGSLVRLNEQRKGSQDKVESVTGTTGHYLLESSIIKLIDPSVITITPESVKADANEWLKGVLDNENNTDEVKELTTELHGKIINCAYDDEMREYVSRCYHRIYDYILNGWKVLSEVRVSLYDWLNTSACDGTSDIVLYKVVVESGVRTMKLIIADLKYGQGVSVSPVMNKQLIMYAAGAMMHLQRLPNVKGAFPVDIDLVIMQPRLGRVWDSYRISYSELYRTVVNDIKPKVEKALGVISGAIEPEFSPSTKTCQWCYHKMSCKAREEKAMEDVSRLFELAGAAEGTPMSSSDIERVSDIDISYIIDRTPFIKSFLDDINEEAYRRLSSGGTVPGYKLVRGRKTRKWVAKDDVVGDKLAALTEQNVYKITLMSPAQVEKLKLTKEQRVQLQSLISETYGNPVMVSESDSRQSIDDDVIDLFNVN